MFVFFFLLFFFFFNDTATTEIYTLSLHDALPIAINGEGLEALERYLRRGQTAALLGSSGVGKSTLINRLAGRELQRVQEINVAADRGRHTTSSRQLILLPAGGVLIDTPGMRELQLWGSAGSLPRAFEDIAGLLQAVAFATASTAPSRGA